MHKGAEPGVVTLLELPIQQGYLVADGSAPGTTPRSARALGKLVQSNWRPLG